MEELGKIKRVVQKVMPDAPHEVLLVLDGSTGQNALEQAKHFTPTTKITYGFTGKGLSNVYVLLSGASTKMFSISACNRTVSSL